MTCRSKQDEADFSKRMIVCKKNESDEEGWSAVRNSRKPKTNSEICVEEKCLLAC